VYIFLNLIKMTLLSVKCIYIYIYIYITNVQVNSVNTGLGKPSPHVVPKLVGAWFSLPMTDIFDGWQLRHGSIR
jgi:hypothetical protein